MPMNIQKKSEMHVKNMSQAFSNLLDMEDKVKIVTNDGSIIIVNKDLLGFSSPLVNSMFSDVPCCTGSVIFLPDATKDSLDQFIVKTQTQPN